MTILVGWDDLLLLSHPQYDSRCFYPAFRINVTNRMVSFQRGKIGFKGAVSGLFAIEAGIVFLTRSSGELPRYIYIYTPRKGNAWNVEFKSIRGIVRSRI